MEISAQGWPLPLRQEWDSLARESDPDLYAEGLLDFARRQERAGRLELAVELYRRLADAPDLAPALRQRARQGLDAILGRGDFGPRAEFLLRTLAQQASEPSALLAMGAAGAAFRLTRLAALSRLAASPRPWCLARLVGAGRLASIAGFAVEAPTFTLVGRLGHEALGREQDWSARGFGRDLASSYLTLGGLRLVGGLATRWGRGQAPVLRGLLQEGGMLSGILLGHRLEEWAGLRERPSGATTLVDSLALLLQFHVAGGLSRAAFGPRWAAWERGLDLQGEALGQTLEAPRRLAAAPAPAGAARIELPTVFMTQGGNEGGNGNHEGRGGRPRSNRPTLAGMAPGPKSSAPTAPPAPPYAEESPFPLADLAPGTRLVRAGSTLSASTNTMAHLLEALEIYFRHYRDPVVLRVDGRVSLDVRQLGVLRVELHRLFREHGVPEGTRVSLLLPAEQEVWHFQKGGLTFEARRESLVAADRKSTLPAPPPAIPTPPPRPSASIPTPVPFRADSLVVEDFEGVKQAFRRLMAGLDTEVLLSPAVRLNRGRVEEKGLQALADILSEHPLPEGRKISVFWVEGGGGTLSFQRQGELVRADWKAYKIPPETYWLVPVASRLGQMQVYRASALPSYPGEGYRGYEVAMEAETKALFSRLAHPGVWEQWVGREEGAARRGEGWARLASHWLKENASPGKTLSPAAQETFLSLHRMLERSQAYLDLGALQRFRDRLGAAKLREYDEQVARFNRGRLTAGLEQLIPLGEFGSRQLGDYVVPLSDHLRAVFCEQLFKSRGGSRIPLENNALLRDPLRLGALFRETLRVRALPLLAIHKMIQLQGLGETPGSLLTRRREELGDHSRKLRDDFEFFLAEWPEFGRILRGGAGSFHRTLLAEVFEGPQSVRDLYQQVLKVLTALPPAERRSRLLDTLPEWAELGNALRGSRP